MCPLHGQFPWSQIWADLFESQPCPLSSNSVAKKIARVCLWPGSRDCISLCRTQLSYSVPHASSSNPTSPPRPSVFPHLPRWNSHPMYPLIHRPLRFLPPLQYRLILQVKHLDLNRPTRISHVPTPHLDRSPPGHVDNAQSKSCSAKNSIKSPSLAGEGSIKYLFSLSSTVTWNTFTTSWIPNSVNP